MGGMNAHYTMRRMCGDGFEERLKNIMTTNHYDYMLPYEDDLKKEAAYGERIWKQAQQADPWELLAAAVIGRAAQDYVECCLQGDMRFTRELEAWFRKNPYSEEFFEELTRRVRKAKSKWELEWLHRSIRLIF